MTENQKVKEKIIRERIQLLLHRPFFGHLTLGLELKEESEVGTMATDGKHLFYNPTFVNGLNPKVLQTILAHETLHCALGHLWRKGERQHMKWNYATDYAINLMLKKEGFPIPANCLCEDKFDGMEAEIIYNKLPDQKLNGSLMDSHDKWPSDGEKEKKKSESKSGAGGDNQDPPQQNKGRAEEQKPQNDGSGDQPRESPQPSSSDGEEEKLAQEWKDRLIRSANAARMQGKLPGAVDRLIKDLLEPKLDWKIILRDMITSLTRNDFRLFPVSKKHLWRNIYLPSLHGEKLEIAVAVDTSGSVSTNEFQEFIAEIRGIAEQFSDFTIYLFFCDAEIHDRITLSPNEEWPDQFPKRDGGTSFTPVINAVTDECPEVFALVYFTDGNGSYPEVPPDYPVIWVLNTDLVFPWGQNIRMEPSNES